MSQTMAVLDDNNKVLNIVVMPDDEPETPALIAYTKENPAHIGGDYFEGFFYARKPFESWSRGGAGSWVAPIPMPEETDEEGNPVPYMWDEASISWVEVTVE